MTVYLRIIDRTGITYDKIHNMKTFLWNGKRFWIWHKEHGKWILIDYDSGMSVIAGTTRRGVKEKLTDELWARLEPVYKKEFYLKAVEELENIRHGKNIG